MTAETVPPVGLLTVVMMLGSTVAAAGPWKVTVMFDERPYFSHIFARACEEFHCNLNDPSISIEGLLSHVASRTIFR